MKKSSFGLKGGLVIGTLLLIAAANPKNPDLYVAIPCPLSKLHIIDWGKCHTAGDAWDCPAAHVEFRTDCVALKGEKNVFLRLNVDRPTVLIDDGTGDSAKK